MTTQGEGTTRRGFMAAIGIGAAALAVPAGAMAAKGSGPAAYIAPLREWYACEIERFAEELRPRFLAGDVGDLAETPGRPWETDGAAFDRLLDEVRDRFGLHTTETKDESDGGVWVEGDAATAHLILAVSPSAEIEGGDGWYHAADWAAAAAEEDLLSLAAKRGWITRD